MLGRRTWKGLVLTILWIAGLTPLREAVLGQDLSPAGDHSEGAAATTLEAPIAGGGERLVAPEVRGEERAPSGKKEPAKPAFELLDQLVREALRSNPSILAARKKWQASTHRPIRVSSLPNPEIRFSSMTSGNPLPYSTIGMGPVDWASFSYMQKVPWPGKLALEKEVAQTDAAQWATEYERTRLEVIRQVKNSFFELYYVDQTTQILSKYRDLLERFARIAEARYSVGQGLLADALRAQVEVSLILEQFELLTGRRERAQALINSLLNRPPDTAIPTLPHLGPVLPELPFSLEGLYLTARERNPEAAAGRLEIQRAASQVDRSRRDFYPDLSFSVGYYMRSSPFSRGADFKNMYEYMVGLELPIFWRRKERLAVEENQDELERTRQEYQRTLQEIVFEIKDAYVTARTARRLVELHRGAVIPQATASLDASFSAYQVGMVDFLTLANDALTILRYELRSEEETRTYLQNLVKLEEQLGVSLVGQVGFDPAVDTKGSTP